MFDIGFQELAVIGVIALLVIGPERLPKLARTAGLYIGKVRRFVTEVRSDVERELHTEEVKRAIKEVQDASPMQDLYDVVEDTRESLSTTVDDLKAAEQSINAPDGASGSSTDDITGNEPTGANALPPATSGIAGKVVVQSVPGADASGPDTASAEPGVADEEPVVARPSVTDTPSADADTNGAEARENRVSA